MQPVKASVRAFGFFVALAAFWVVFESPASAATAAASASGIHIIAAFDLVKWWSDPLQDAALWTMENFLKFANEGSEPNITADWFRGQHSLMTRLAVFLTVPILLMATMSALLKGGLREVLHTYLVGLPVSVIGAVVAIGMISLLQQIDDNLTDAVIGLSNDGFQAYFDSLKGVSDAQMSLGIMLLMNFICLGLILGGLALKLELIFRQAMIYMSVLFLPLALATYAWAATRRWAFMLFEIIGTMVMAKFVIFSVIGFGFTALAAGMGGAPIGGSTDFWGGLGQMMAGMLIVMMGAFAAPTLIGFIMAPRHEVIRRTTVLKDTPLDGDRGAGRQTIKKGAKAMLGRSG